MPAISTSLFLTLPRLGQDGEETFPGLRTGANSGEVLPARAMEVFAQRLNALVSEREGVGSE